MRSPLYFAGSSLVVQASFLGQLIGWGRRDLRSCSAIYKTNETEYRLEFSEIAREFKLDAISAAESIVHMGPSASAKFRLIGLVERGASAAGRGAVGKSPKAACLEAIAAHLDLGHEYALDEQAREAINSLIDGQTESAYHSSLPSRPHLSKEPRRRSLPEGSTIGDGRSRDNFTAAILSLDEAPSGGFDLSSLGDVMDGMRGLGGIVGRMTLRDAWSGMQTKKDAECSLARVFNVEPSLQYDYRMTIDKEGNAAASLTIKVLKDGIVEKKELTASAASFAEKSGIFVLEGGTLAATVIREFVADELKRVRESRKVKVVVKRDPEELKDPVLCEASQMGNLHATKRQLGLAHLKAALEYGRAVLIGKREERPDEKGAEMKDIVDWEGKEMEEGLLAMERAVTENPDMPCRATWDTDDKRYYFEMYRDDEELATKILDLRMITDGITEVYPLRSLTERGPYETARAKCLQQWPASSPRSSTRKTCLISIACYLWYAKILAAGSKGKTTTGPKFFEALGQIQAAAEGEDSGPIDLGRTPAAYLDGLLPAIHSHALKRVRNDPELGFVLSVGGPVCRAFSSTPGDREGFTRELALYALSSDRVVLGESYLSEEQLKERAGKEGGPPSYDEEKRLDQLVTIGDPAMGRRELGADQRVRGWMAELLVAEMKDQNRVWAQRAWTQPVEELPLYKLKQSALSVWMMEIMMRSDMTWTTVTTTPKGNVTAFEGPPLDVDDHFEAEVSSPSVCGIEVMAKGGAAKKGRRPSMNQKSLLIALCKGALFEYLSTASAMMLDERTFGSGTHARRLEVSALTTKSLVRGTGGVVVFRVDEGSPFGSAVEDMYNLAMDSDRDCSLSRMAERIPFPEPISVLHDITMKSTPSRGVIVSGEPFSLMNSRKLSDVTLVGWDILAVRLGLLRAAAPVEFTDGCAALGSDALQSFREDVTTKLMDPALGEEGFPRSSLVEALDSCSIETVEKRKTGGAVPRFSLSLRSDFSMHRIGLPDGTLGFLEELRPLWRLLPALPRPRMTVVEVCQQTLFDYLRAAQEKLPNSVDRLQEDHYQEMGSAVVTRGSTTFQVGEKTAVGKALVGLAEMMRDSIE
ncbi:hypothetical protein FOZ60_016288 [Perkinsus olseni]|uniref:Uncharacterized protein n=1 Tax=Perkinsus olseni TaxID=32597 RepID=A0A7J6P5M2_PEROL|nr:hypothetical protein FOZ60_016288 [Perkinsus olseni]